MGAAGRGVTIPFVLMTSERPMAHKGRLFPNDSSSHSCSRPPGPKPSPHTWILIPVSFCALGPSLRWVALFPATEERSENGLVSSLHWRFCHPLGTSAQSCLAGPRHPLPSNFQPRWRPSAFPLLPPRCCGGCRAVPCTRAHSHSDFYHIWASLYTQANSEAGTRAHLL